MVEQMEPILQDNLVLFQEYMLDMMLLLVLELMG
jgi:hypothetical protein